MAEILEELLNETAFAGGSLSCISAMDGSLAGTALSPAGMDGVRAAGLSMAGSARSGQSACGYYAGTGARLPVRQA